MRANININIHIDQVNALSRSMLANEGQRLLDLVKGYSESIMTPLDENDLDQVLENLDELREHLADVDLMLAQAGNILSGYHNREREEEEIDTKRLKSSIETRLQEAEKFNSFLEKISDQAVLVDEGNPDDGEE
jgi:flavorubredoxin